MTMAAAFSVLLHRYSSGTTFASAIRWRTATGRSSRLIGLFVSMLVLRVRFSPEQA